MSAENGGMPTLEKGERVEHACAVTLREHEAREPPTLLD